MYQELRMRRVVADTLGVGLEDLLREASLRDDLAADSLDLVELALALEAKFGISVPERVLDWVRSYGDLVEATVDRIRVRLAAESRSAEQPARFVARSCRPRVGQAASWSASAGSPRTPSRRSPKTRYTRAAAHGSR